MGTVGENREYWTGYDWSRRGDEWSGTWGGTDVLWSGTLWPRIRSFLPTGKLLEIATGYGRITSFLLDRCDHFVGVDLTENCVRACQARFEAREHACFFVTDGTSLPNVGSSTVDFAFSFDSLVHAEASVMKAYVHELARVLCPGGAAFLHHSNAGSFIDDATGKLRINNTHWRAESMTAELMRDFAIEAGIRCEVQEIVNWGCSELIDCFSLLVAGNSSTGGKTRIIENPRFMDEATALGRAAAAFVRKSESGRS